MVQITVEHEPVTRQQSILTSDYDGDIKNIGILNPLTMLTAKMAKCICKNIINKPFPSLFMCMLCPLFFLPGPSSLICIFCMHGKMVTIIKLIWLRNTLSTINLIIMWYLPITTACVYHTKLLHELLNKYILVNECTALILLQVCCLTCTLRVQCGSK